ncbi:zinc-binding alcohol dehydrogenase family protein [Kutzneria sp. NPDC052558]|uniref:zinc-binding alcohol dehydrogenase family protein n=1 Tax=Kutzneria sp. NPDC052558 TaxID=3364121 RepID=UPI0037CBBC41
MFAAVVTEFGKLPTYQEIPDPQPRPGEVLVDMLAVGLHRRMRSGAAGTHYTSEDTLPLVPGFDGVGRTASGDRVFVSGLDAPHGTLAQRVAVPADRLIPVPPGVASEQVAAVMNPAMSAWVALTQRASLRPGETVLVLGATGNAGQAAVQLAKHLGAARVIAAGRNTAVLSELLSLGADEVVALSEDGLAVAADVDVVVDYLWGPPAEAALAAIGSSRSDSSRAVRWVHVGAMAGATITLPGAALRKTNLVISGSGQGSVSDADLHEAHRELLEALPHTGLHVDTVNVPLADVEQAWNRETPSGSRVVFVMAE